MSKLHNLFRKLSVACASNSKFIQLLRKDGVVVGDNCVIDKRTVFGSEPYLIEIGNHVRITQGVKFITHDGGLWVPREMGLVDKRSDKFGRIIVGDNVNIGWNAIIMPNVTIGHNVIIAAGAIVTRDVPNDSVVAGVPARVIESIDEYVKKNIDKLLLTKDKNSEEKKIAILESLRED